MVFLCLMVSSGCGRPPLVLPEGRIDVAPLDVSPAANGPRFQRMDPERTGIDFVHRWTPPEKYQHELPYL